MFQYASQRSVFVSDLRRYGFISACHVEIRRDTFPDLLTVSCNEKESAISWSKIFPESRDHLGI